MKALARELIWFFIAVILAIPLAYILADLTLDLQPETKELSMEEEVFREELFIIGGLLGFICTYFIRVIIWAVAKYLIKEDS